MELNIFDTVLL